MQSRTSNRRPAAGFTLVELLVAITIMALLALLSWRGLDGMARAQEQTRTRADDVLALQAGLSQWGADLDAVAQFPRTLAMDWDGRALRITRRGTAGPGDGMRVVAWSRRTLADGAQWWLRWESAPLVTRAQWQQAWDQAAQWAQNPGDDLRQREVAVAPAGDWQIFYYRNNAWTNPLSSAAGSVPADPAAAGSTPPPAAAPAAAVTVPALPDGVRLVLSLSPGRAISGTLVRDWVNPAIGGGKAS
ncbi:MAG: prepilin-type N-terminal cleavage/methylation domain-containing protein [Pseudomonadota bacterium]